MLSAIAIAKFHTQPSFPVYISIRRSSLRLRLQSSIPRKPLSAENEKHNGSGHWCVCSLEDIWKKLRWEKSPTALEAEAEADGNGNFSSVNGGEGGPCAFQMPVHYPRYSKADYESMAEWELDDLLQQYGLPIRGDVAFKRSYVMGAFLWPGQL